MTTDTTPTPTTPPAVDDAAAILALFRSRGSHLVSRGPGVALNDDDRAAVLAAQLAAMVAIGENLVAALEHAVDLLAIMAYPGAHPGNPPFTTATGAGKTRTTHEYAAMYPDLFGVEGTDS